MLSKSKFCRGTKCAKSLWLYVNQKQEQVISESTAAIFSRGKSAGELARDYFPNGELAVLEGEFPSYQTAKRTQELIEQGVGIIYEATFISKNTVVAVDILHKNNNGNWDIYEVKSTNSAKEEHELDVAIQHFIVKNSGLNVENAYVMHFNRDYVRHGKIEVIKLFIPTDVTIQSAAYQQNMEEKIEEFHQLVTLTDEPDVQIGNQCEHPYHCDFWDYCQSQVCHSENEAEETQTATDYTADIDKQEVRDFVKSIKYPIAHFDFETLMAMGIPMWENSRPYQKVPFQYSIHKQESSISEVIHSEYLAIGDTNVDPRIDLIKNMIKDLEKANTIFVYNDTFEKMILRQLIVDFPQYEIDIQYIIDRIVDLASPFKYHYYQFLCLPPRRWSIKVVLPLICPELSYNDLEIGDGGIASNTFYDLYFSNASEEEKAEIRKHLKAYCKMDTWGMVRIWEELRKV